MNDQTDQQLLRDYAERHSEAAFAAIVHRYVDLVYSAAFRMICNDHSAKDVTQSVFVALAQNTRELTDRPALAGWLHCTARNLAAKTVRTDIRRRAREQEAAAMNEILSANPDTDWEFIAPHLDDALGELSEQDRDAVLLRYFKNHDLHTVGATLGISDDAAQKRVSRAVERLREFFAKRGVTVGTGGLAVIISANAVQAAPTGLALTISTAAALTGTITTATFATHTTMNWLNLKSTTAVLAAALAAGTGMYFVQEQTAAQLRAENRELLVAQQSLTKERDDALAVASLNFDDLKRRESDKSELLRLRGEVGPLRRRAMQADQLAEENRQYQEAFSKLAQNTSSPDSKSETDPEKRVAIERLTQSRQIVLSLIMFAADNEDKFPTNLNSVSNYLGNLATDLLNDSFELVLQGALTNVPNPSSTIAIRSKSPFPMNGESAKVYGFADGHAELKREPSEGFDAWEKARIIFTPTGQ